MNSIHELCDCPLNCRATASWVADFWCVRWKSATWELTRYIFCEYSLAHERGTWPRTRAHRTHDVPTPTTTHKGWRFATESHWTLWHTSGSRQGHPRYTGARTGKHDRQGLETNVLSENPGVDTLGNFHGSGVGSRNREIYGELSNSVNKNVVDRTKVETRPRSSRRSCRETEPFTQEKINQEKINQETEYIKIPAESAHWQSCWCDCWGTATVSPGASDAQKELEKETR